jgi:hypothetical protein
MPVILATQETEIRRIVVRNQPRQIVHEILCQKSPLQKRTGGVAQSVDPEFKPQYHKKKSLMRPRPAVFNVLFKSVFPQGL